MATLMIKSYCGLIRKKRIKINRGVDPRRIDAFFVEVIEFISSSGMLAAQSLLVLKRPNT